jgi:hypothetical protein
MLQSSELTLWVTDFAGPLLGYSSVTVSLDLAAHTRYSRCCPVRRSGRARTESSRSNNSCAPNWVSNLHRGSRPVPEKILPERFEKSSECQTSSDHSKTVSSSAPRKGSYHPDQRSRWSLRTRVESGQAEGKLKRVERVRPAPCPCWRADVRGCRRPSSSPQASQILPPAPPVQPASTSPQPS